MGKVVQSITCLAELTYCKSAQSFIDGDKTQELWHELSMDAMVT